MPDAISSSPTPVQPVQPAQPVQAAAPALPTAPATDVPATPAAPTTAAPAPDAEAPVAGPTAPAAPVEEKKPPKPFSWKDQYDEAAKKGGKLTASELKLPKSADANKDGKIEYQEYRVAKVKANSFEGLDKDHSGTLDAKELAKMQRYDDRQYGDGVAVTKDEFNKTRQKELFDNRTARLKQKFKDGLSKEEAAKMKRFAGSDGKLSAQEYADGRRQQWREWHQERQDKLFARAGGEKGVLDVTTKDGARYKSYDADGDGKVSKAEFKQGYKADLHAAWNARTESGSLTAKGVRDRLAYGTDTFARKIEMPASLEDVFKNREKWFISQYGDKYNTNEDLPGWDNGNCGPTSLTMVAKAFGKIDPNAAEADAAIEKSRKLIGESQLQTKGVSADGIVRGAEAYGLDAHVVKDIDLGKIEGELKKGRLPIINGNVIRPDGSYGGGHYYVVTKIEGGKAYLNDPYSKTGPTVVSTDRLMTSVNSHWSHQLISIGDKG